MSELYSFPAPTSLLVAVPASARAAGRAGSRGATDVAAGGGRGGLTERLEKTQTEGRGRQEDIESLRFEVGWKDERIRYLEEQLSRAPPAAALARSDTSSPETAC